MTPMFIVKLIFTPLSEMYGGLMLWMGKNYKPVIIDGNVQNYTSLYGFEDRDDIDRGKVADVVTSLNKIFDDNYVVTWMVNPIWI